MRQFAIFFSSILIATCESAFAFRATVEDVTLEIPVPIGWHKASYTEQKGLEMGMQEEGEYQQKQFPAIIKNCSDDTTTWVITVGVLPSVTSNEATVADLQAIGVELKKVSDAEQPVESDDDEFGMVIRGHLTKFVEGDNFVAIEMDAKSSFSDKELFKSAPTSYWALNGFILINRHIYSFNAAVGDGTPSQRREFSKFAREWLRELTDANRYSLRPVEVVDTSEIRRKPVPDKFDQWNAGDVDGNSRSLLKKSFVRDLQDGEWKTLDLASSSRFENLKISIQYPEKFKLEKVSRGPMLFKFISRMADDRIFCQMDVSSQPMTKDTELLLKMISKDKVDNDVVESALTRTAPTSGRIIGFGPTTVNGRYSLWYTTLISETRLGLNIIAIERTYKIPMSRGVLLTMKFGVASVNTSFAPVNEFLDLLPMGIRFVGSIHEDDPVKGQDSQIPENFKGSGTGWFVNKDHIVTCWHVVSDATAIRFQTPSGKSTKLTLVDKDIASDIAVLKVEDQEFYCDKPLHLSFTAPAVAESVCTVGYPIPELMGQEPKYTVGVVSALSGIMGDTCVMQISTPVQPGNSGGALLNDAGEVVGVVQGRLREEVAGVVSGSSPQNVNYAIKLEPVLKLLSQNNISHDTQFGNQKLSHPQIYNCAKDATVFIIAQ